MRDSPTVVGAFPTALAAVGGPSVKRVGWRGEGSLTPPCLRDPATFYNTTGDLSSKLFIGNLSG